MRRKKKLVVSWNEPDARKWIGIATRYKICHSTKEHASGPKCDVLYGRRATKLSYEITSLQPSTKHFVTVSAGTSVGFGPRSEEISKITNGGRDFSR